MPPIGEENILNKDIFDYFGIYYCSCFTNHSWLVMLNEQRRMYPIISEFVRKFVYNNELEDYYNVYESRINIVKKETHFTRPLFSVGVVSTKYVLCPICELNYMYEGKEAYELCTQKTFSRTKIKIEDIIPVSIMDIYCLWCALLGKKPLFAKTFDFSIIKDVLLKNKNIRHVKDEENYDVCDQTDVFNEFFCNHSIIGPYIQQKGIRSYGQLSKQEVIVKGNISPDINEKAQINNLIANNSRTVLLLNVKTKETIQIKINSHICISHKNFHGKKINETVMLDGNNYIILEIRQ